MTKTENDSLAETVRQYLKVKELGRKSIISVTDGKKKRKELREKMAKLTGYKL